MHCLVRKNWQYFNIFCLGIKAFFKLPKSTTNLGHISINGAPTNFLTHAQFGVEAHFGVYYANFLTYTTLSHFHFWAQAHFGTQASTFFDSQSQYETLGPIPPLGPMSNFEDNSHFGVYAPWELMPALNSMPTLGPIPSLKFMLTLVDIPDPHITHWLRLK